MLLSVYSLLVIWISSKKGSSVLDKLIINQLADYGQVIWLFLLLIGISMFVYGLVFGKEEKGRHL